MSKFNPYLRHNIASKTCLASNKTVNRLNKLEINTHMVKGW